MKDIAPWIAAIIMGLGNMGQLVDRAVTENKLQAEIRISGQRLEATITLGHIVAETFSGEPTTDNRTD